jgi:hypothetical protein
MRFAPPILPVFDVILYACVAAVGLLSCLLLRKKTPDEARASEPIAHIHELPETGDNEDIYRCSVGLFSKS